MYVLHRAAQVGSDRINVSTRDTAIGSGVTRRTAERALNRLVSAGWLVRKYAGDGLACEYKCCIMTHITLSEKQIHMGHDATRVIQKGRFRVLPLYN
jgi:hypothetical protein